MVALTSPTGCSLLTHLVHSIPWNEFWILSTMTESKECIFKFIQDSLYYFLKNIPWNKLANSPGLRKSLLGLKSRWYSRIRMAKDTKIINKKEIQSSKKVFFFISRLQKSRHCPILLVRLWVGKANLESNLPMLKKKKKNQQNLQNVHMQYKLLLNLWKHVQPNM